jgi:hypothetical protein
MATHLRLVAIAAMLALSLIDGGCGASSHTIVGKWHSPADATAMVWEFFPNGAVMIGRDKGRYTFGDQRRIKIEMPFAKSIYQMELVGDRLMLQPMTGAKLELTRIK